MYNAANQMTHDGTNTLTYDPNGNLTSDGTNTYIWDRANRLLSMGGVSYGYDGDGNRIQQNALEYILDLQPALAQVIGDSDGKRYIHAPRGIHAQHNGTSWQYPIADGLGSVRGYVAPDSTLLSSVNYSELGVPDTAWEGFAFTGEMRSENGTQYHRARHLAPSLGIWASLDPFEGLTERPMSLNGYAWVEGNVANATDASGRCPRLDGGIKAAECELLRIALRLWGVNVVYDTVNSVLDPGSSCLPEQISGAVNQSHGVRQRWTPDEMRAVYNAFRIFDKAHYQFQNLNMDYDYKWPLSAPITIEKRRYAGWSNADRSAYVSDPASTGNPIGIHYYTGGIPELTRKIVMGAARWGESNINMTQQSRSWLVLHEFMHIFSRDRLVSRCGSYYDAEAYLLGRATNIKEEGGLDFSTSGGPTQYSTYGAPGSARLAFGQEYYTEAITGVVWNYGYSAVGSYTSNAGGWYRENVLNITGNDGTRLSTWVLNNVIGLTECPVK